MALRQTASRLIKRFGSEVTVRTITAVQDEDEGWKFTNSFEDTLAYAVFSSISEKTDEDTREYDEAKSLVDKTICYISPISVAVINVGDEIIDGDGTTYQVTLVKQLNPKKLRSENILYELELQ